MLDHAHLTPQDAVLEIGPGRGVLTELILPRVRSLVAIEIDPVLSAELRRRWASVKHLQVLTADFLRIDLNHLLSLSMTPLPPDGGRGEGEGVGFPPLLKVIGNLPYAVTAPILQRLLPWTGWSEAILMVQREVADRLTSPPGRRTYGLLTVATQCYATPSLLTIVPPCAFQPLPKIHSATLRLSRHAPLAPAPVIDRALHLARQAFQHRRKTLLNALLRAEGASKPDLLRAFEQLTIDPNSRPEDLATEEFLRLGHTLPARRKNGVCSA